MSAVPLDEREAVQKKTFTKWVNSHLARVTCRISDLYMDLRDGRVLIKLLEVLSGELLVGIPSSWRPWDLWLAMALYTIFLGVGQGLGWQHERGGVPGQGLRCLVWEGGC